MDIDIMNLLLRLQRSGMTQKEIADEAGCGQSTISEMSRGKIGKVRPSFKIVSAFLRLAEERALRSEQRQVSKRRRSSDKGKTP